MNRIVLVKLSQIAKKNGRSTVISNVRIRGRLYSEDRGIIATVVAAASVPYSLTSTNARWRTVSIQIAEGGEEMASNRARCGSNAGAIPSCESGPFSIA